MNIGVMNRVDNAMHSINDGNSRSTFEELTGKIVFSALDVNGSPVEA